MKDEALDLIIKILLDRVVFYEKYENYDVASAYSTALDLLGYAVDDNIECLKQFDCSERE